MTAIQQSGPGSRSADQIEMRVPADPTWIPSLRVVAADLATRADFDLDAVSDLRMAVDESCAQLVGAARPEAELVCRFTTDHGDRITMTATVAMTSRVTISRESFGWRILTTLADEVEVLGDGSETLGLRLCKLRQVVP